MPQPSTSHPTSPLALAGVRVLEIGSGSALAYAGKLFADFGAEVIKLEDSEGDPLRTYPPLINTDGPELQSALFAWLNTNKRSVSLHSQNAQELEWLSRLAQSCDVVLDARALREGPAALQQSVSASTVPGTAPIEICLTWFGESGPYANFVGSEAVCRALAGAVYGSGAAEGPPHLPHDIQTGIVAGLAAFSSAIAALIGQGDGSRRYTLSIHEIVFSIVEMEAGMVQDGRHPLARLGINRFCTTHPGGIYETQSGWIGIFAHTLPQWVALCNAIGVPEHAADPRFASGPTRIQYADEIDHFLRPALLKKTAKEWFTLLGQVKFPAVLVPSMEELLKQQVHRERDAFVQVQAGSIKFEGVTAPFPLGDAGPLKGGITPVQGADNAYYRTDVALQPSRALPVAAQNQAPLRAIRVIDLTMGWAGPLATRTLADFGAEVIKVEGTQYPDWWRGTHYTEEFYRERQYEKNSNFAWLNRNKLGITLDLTQAEGRNLLLELIKTADIVIENYSSEVLPKLGLDYDTLAAVNSRLIMLSMPAFGAGNAWSQIRAYGGTLEQASGLPHYTGFAQNPPSLTSYAYGDPVGGWNGGAAALLALLVQARTGQGRHINLSQVEAMLPMTAPFLIEQSLTGQVSPRQGNHHSVHAPHNIYRCAGNDEWIVISIATDKQWQSLLRLLPARTLTRDAFLMDSASRCQHRVAIDDAIQSWTACNNAEELMQLLQSNHISAGVVRPIWSVLHDKHLLDTAFFQPVQRSYLGCYYTSVPWFRLQGQAPAVRCPPPTLGQHSKDVFRSILGMSQEQISALFSCGITGTEATRKSAKVTTDDAKA
ncbi:CaiB/BaiF CoA-transferase family protein [Comamonas sp. NoAH]|uniref:CaiB/BaiF CoA-transferase family protein n=1 Tax=Comamonas halotolerans TaxID=3041496 RepID=UPI0024E07738|nr:CoA transferase [Comamonas sp. NoAH]